MGASQPQPGPFAFTKAKAILLVSLLLTWWIAHLLPSYEPIIRAQVSSRLQEARQKIPAIKVDWKLPEQPASQFDTRKVALLIEPRPLPHLVPLILHMVAVVPPDWRFVFIGSDKSVFSVGRSYAVKHQQVIGKLDLLELPDPWTITNKEMVHRMLTDIRFYDEFLPGVEWILKYEADSILCANSPKSLNDWLEWSWAGAPRSEDDRFAGNGGLSLRKVSAIRRILSFQARFNNTEAEDEWFGRRLWVLPGEKVTSGLNALAVENVYVEKPMGFHVANGGKSLPDEVWKNKDQRKKIFDYCPELSLIVDMKMERERCDGDDHEGNIVRDWKKIIASSKSSVASVKSRESASRASASASAASVSSVEAAKTKEPSKTDSDAKPGSAKDSDSPKETGSSENDKASEDKESEDGKKEDEKKEDEKKEDEKKEDEKKEDEKKEDEDGETKDDKNNKEDKDAESAKHR